MKAQNVVLIISGLIGAGLIFLLMKTTGGYKPPPGLQVNITPTSFTQGSSGIVTVTGGSPNGSILLYGINATNQTKYLLTPNNVYLDGNGSGQFTVTLNLIAGTYNINVADFTSSTNATGNTFTTA